MGNTTHSVREMMIGLREAFQYLECAACGCLQLGEVPKDMARYYPPGYYSFRCSEPRRGILRELRHFARNLRNRALLRGQGVLSRVVESLLPDPPLAAIGFAQPKRDMRVLDVGSGFGRVPVDLRDAGFVSILGIDAFIEQDIQHPNGVQIRKGLLSDLTGSSWDLIVFHHSFEHMWEQRSTLALVRELLSAGGRCLLSIPIAAWPWKRYGINWVELDAPRHFYLHTERSVRLLASQTGFHVSDVKYDSSEFQFWGSELYLRDMSLNAVNHGNLARYFNRKQRRTFRRESRKLNRERQAGRATVYLVKPC
jgi:SAM-dependent methyltransferase